MPNPTAPHQTNQKIADAHTVLKLCTGKNKNSMGAKFKCGVQRNSVWAVQEHSVFLSGWEILCKAHCYVQLKRMLYFCLGRNTNGIRRGSRWFIELRQWGELVLQAASPTALQPGTLQYVQSALRSGWPDNCVASALLARKIQITEKKKSSFKTFCFVISCVFIAQLRSFLDKISEIRNNVYIAEH